jgi:hypothetical protein
MMLEEVQSTCTYERWTVMEAEEKRRLLLASLNVLPMVDANDSWMVVTCTKSMKGNSLTKTLDSLSGLVRIG